ncbi:MAG TPA: PEP-CTERM sorting domain-containing protein [Phycisphaerales bacterium]|nr:PEP-CTERM sorting domain-containing protein [Phycisphaerales bacterium]
MVRVTRVSLSVVLVAMICACATAVPTWQTDPLGQPPTTYQLWTFDDNTNPAVPKPGDVENAYGSPVARLEGQGTGDETFGWYRTYDGRDGVWHAEALTIILTIPNRPDPDAYKEIWVSAIIQGLVTAAHVTPIPAGDAVIPLGQTLTDIGGGWSRLDIGWRVEPNPSSEIICMALYGTGGSIDRLEVHTICVPEPATVFLLGAGALLLRRRR